MIILARNENQPRSGKKTAIVIAAITVCVVLLLAVSARNFQKAAEYDSRAREVSEEAESHRAAAEEESEIISGKGFDKYCEDIARKEYGYAKPGEYVLYDSSYGN